MKITGYVSSRIDNRSITGSSIRGVKISSSCYLPIEVLILISIVVFFASFLIYLL